MALIHGVAGADIKAGDLIVMDDYGQFVPCPNGEPKWYVSATGTVIDLSSSPVPITFPEDFVIDTNLLTQTAESKPQCKHQWTMFDDKCSQCGMTFEEYRQQVYKHSYVNKCTCGAEKAGFDSHSHWCDKKETR